MFPEFFALLVSYRSLAPKNFHRYYRARRLRQTRPRAFIYVIPNATLLTIHWIDPAAACEYSYLLSAYADDEKAALAYNKAVSDAGLAGVRELNRVDASGRPVPKSRAAQFTVTIHGGRD